MRDHTICLVSTLFLLIAAAGCSDSSAPESEHGATTSSKTSGKTSSEDDSLRLKVQINEVIDGDETTVTNELFDSFDADDVKKHFHSIKWSAPELIPHIGVIRTVSGKASTLYVQRADSAPDAIRLRWFKDFVELREVSPITDLDLALRALLSFYANDGEWKTMVEWSDPLE